MLQHHVQNLWGEKIWFLDFIVCVNDMTSAENLSSLKLTAIMFDRGVETGRFVSCDSIYRRLPSFEFFLSLIFTEG